MYYAYIRVSTSTQAEHGFGLDTQRQAINDYCAKNNIVLSGEFADEGISGTVLERPALTEMLSLLEKGDRIVVLNTSRLWRNDTVKVLARREIEKAGADIISVEQPTYTVYAKDPNDWFINSMQELLDMYDKMQITKKLAAGRRTKAKAGSKACGSAAYGYKWDDAQIIIDYNNHLVVQDIYRIFADNHNLTATAAMAKAKGYKTSTGKDFSKQSISNMVHNDFYIGIVTHDGKKYHGTHDPIIVTELFMSCNPDYVKIP